MASCFLDCQPRQLNLNRCGADFMLSLSVRVKSVSGRYYKVFRVGSDSDPRTQFLRHFKQGSRLNARHDSEG